MHGPKNHTINLCPPVKAGVSIHNFDDSINQVCVHRCHQTICLGCCGNICQRVPFVRLFPLTPTCFTVGWLSSVLNIDIQREPGAKLLPLCFKPRPAEVVLSRMSPGRLRLDVFQSCPVERRPGGTTRNCEGLTSLPGKSLRSRAERAAKCQNTSTCS